MGADRGERLDAWLAHRGFGTRTEVKRLIRRGDVTVDGAICRDGDTRIVAQAVAVDGEPVESRATSATLMLHKPVGYACSHDAREAPLVGELIPADLAHLPLEWAGRLDRDTSGLLVLTTDGALIHALTHPRRHVAKRYRVVYSGVLPPDAEARCAAGIVLPDDARPTLPAVLDRDPPDAAGHPRATLHLTEGRYHQVRRMFAALGALVVELHRDRVGGLELGDLAAGQVRALDADAIARMLGGAISDQPSAVSRADAKTQG